MNFQKKTDMPEYESQHPEDKYLSKAFTDVKDEKSFEKKSSMKILDSFDGKSTTQNNQLKKIAITKNIINRLKDTKVGLEGRMPATKTPFNFSTSRSNINSFYKRTAFISSFNKEDSISFSRQDSTARQMSPPKINPSNITNDQSTSARSQAFQFQDTTKFSQAQDSAKFNPKQFQNSEPIDGEENLTPEEASSLSANPRNRHSLSQKVRQLNEKSYKFIPSIHTRHSSINK